MNIFSPSLINSIFSFLSLLSWIVLLIITAKFIDKKEENKRIKASLAKLEGAFKDLDEQARLIVKTDLELNKTQEELDKKISSLYTLHKLSRAMSTTLIEEEILQRIEDSLILELGFERCLVLFLKDSQLISKLNVGYSDKELQNVQSQFANVLEDRHLESLLFEKSLCASSVKLETDKQLLNRVSSCLGLASFIICPIKTQEEFLGIIIMGNTSSVFSITEGDEDLVAILANQIGQAIENARLFEQTWRTQQDLEKKVKERTKELTQAFDEIKAISKRKTDFVSAVSHELRTPLTSIKGYASILASGKLGEVSGQIKERLDKINRHSDELTKLINDLLDISRIEAGKLEMKLEAQDISSILTETADLLMPQIKEKQIQLNLEMPPGLEKVLIDRSQIARVFINLIGNAVKFTPANGRIQIKAQDSKEYIQVDVIDSGIGIPAQDLEHIFEEFYRVDNPINQQVKGTGLGLTLVKHIVEVHKGKIWATSQLNHGSSFSFTLPKAKLQ